MGDNDNEVTRQASVSFTGGPRKAPDVKVDFHDPFKASGRSVNDSFYRDAATQAVLERRIGFPSYLNRGKAEPNQP